MYSKSLHYVSSHLVTMCYIQRGLLSTRMTCLSSYPRRRVYLSHEGTSAQYTHFSEGNYAIQHDTPLPWRDLPA